jgi:putative ABC transport system permease protein
MENRELRIALALNPHSTFRTEMTFRTLIRRSLRFHWRSHLGVVLGAAIGSAALIGALVVGDSVKESLHKQAIQRLGAVHFALSSGDRLFRSGLATDLQNVYAQQQANSSNGSFAPALQFPATVIRSDGTARANQVSLLGVDEHWPRIGGDSRLGPASNSGIWLNGTLANHLGVAAGDTVLLRLPKPTALSHEASISQRADQTIVMRLIVLGVVPSLALGDFSLSAGRGAGFNAFVPLDVLQAAAGVTDQANLLLVSDWEVKLTRPLSKWGQIKTTFDPVSAPLSIVTSTGSYDAFEFRGKLTSELLDRTLAFSQVLKLADLQLKLLPAGQDELALTSPRIFLDPAIGQAATVFNTNANLILTYLATLLRAGTNATPYSMVNAAGAPWTPAGLRDDEIVVSQWLADDLQVKPGDEIALSYFLPESGRAAGRSHKHVPRSQHRPVGNAVGRPHVDAGVSRHRKSREHQRMGCGLSAHLRDSQEG